MSILRGIFFFNKLDVDWTLLRESLESPLEPVLMFEWLSLEPRNRFLNFWDTELLLWDRL